MPELPEVETVVRDLRPHLTGRRIVRVQAGEKRLRGHWSADWPERLAGRKFTAIRRRGKWILIDMDRGLLVVHLGMTGRLTVGAADRPIEDHTHLVIDLDDGRQLRFRDVRRFGSVAVYESAKEFETVLGDRLGPEPGDLGRVEFREALSSTARSLKAVLLDQRVVAGVGNIYADEALFTAKLPPNQLGRATTPAEGDRLRKAIVQVLAKAVNRRGSTIRDYVDGSGKKGSFQNEFRLTAGRATRARAAGRRSSGFAWPAVPRIFAQNASHRKPRKTKLGRD